MVDGSYKCSMMKKAERISLRDLIGEEKEETAKPQNKM